ncbi:CpaF family protein [Cupriavidus taiwanensis]|uniref:Type IV secretory pathway, conjugal transfert protein putative chaperonin n=1 Tax=Cupriavidus taiwanensis TaxID=164546 RepID=A0A375JC17_9BURK|nr:ATPase, T2SS/T4P/T4SS family [Cupriavidus taiwanensis]SPS02322.1 type IV secretory pathway, conjugal transfert protein; putative chaperonin [Cupriavidus taiwanensis]
MESASANHPLLQLTQLADSAVSMFFESLAPLHDVIHADDVAEVMINRHNSIWVERRGVMTRLDVELDPFKVEGAIRSLASSVEKSAVRGTSQGIINAGHKGLRIAAVMQPTSIEGHALSIRRHREKNMRLSDYVKAGAFSSRHARTEAETPIFTGRVEDEALAQALGELVRQRKNILVAGGTSSGKTTLLNAMVGEIPPDERVITIEDTTELKPSVPNVVRLLSNADKGVTTQHLVALSLRFRPDRILVGEVRGGEAYDMLQAFNTGHDGGMGSLHAPSPRMALSRLESMALLGIPPGSGWKVEDMRRLIADCIHYVVHMKRSGDMRVLSEIIEIKGFRNNDYEFQRVF